MKPKRRHIVALAIFVPVLLVALYLTTISSVQFEDAKRFVLEDASVSASIGHVTKADFKFWNGFEFGSGKANYSFEATTEQGVFTVGVYMEEVCGTWRVQAANIRMPDGPEKQVTSAAEASAPCLKAKSAGVG